MTGRRMKVGDVYHSLTVVELLPGRRVRCLCSCGDETTIFRNNLPSGNTTSCGHVWREEVALAGTHYKCTTPEYRSWSMMKNRCNNPKAHNYSYYGGRGITVDPVWDNSFEAFLLDMGERPNVSYTLDRTDNDGGYNPDNCKWVTKQAQARNRRQRKDAKKAPQVV